jgi:protein-S-isoprenylcysteine O-methyltransferase Ste14
MTVETGVVYLALVGACLTALAIRTRYELMKRVGTVDTTNPRIFAIVFAAMVAMLLSWPFLASLDPLELPLPDVVRWAGLAVSVPGVALAVGGLLQLRGLENVDHLVTSGLYSKLRHPMYAGFVAWILGWVVYGGAASGFAVAIVAVANIHFWVRLEERHLEAQFGDEYVEYEKATWF